MPKNIVTDRDPIFLSKFWRELFKRQGVSTFASTAYHPQEWWYNTSYHSSIKTTPYEAVYGQSPPLHIPYIARDSAVETVDRTLVARENMRKELKEQLRQV
ncbi:hypothetical protein AXF42_Ash021656 [Apostasia shenzhenica]|uniref:Integrase catalytic domain-containing protein n=1 Tax=Apostasia shenzhenica TaxID=1088818 RepID=A0A2H9ZY00_9ASPA|nr:hypothetical protein AXF42_Ash021656 [Apostasia shenzhenica]